jgi:hypothetical protein
MKLISTIVLLGFLAASSAKASSFRTKDEMLHCSVLYDSQAANDCVKTLCVTYPHLILLSRQPTFQISPDHSAIYIRVIYAIDLGYGYSRGPFHGCYLITWHDDTNIATKLFYDTDTQSNPFTGEQ